MKNKRKRSDIRGDSGVLWKKRSKSGEKTENWPIIASKLKVLSA